jgi:nucleoside-diphosphate-sugar epimerase
MKKILVTGACGWLGAEISRTLLARGDAVVAMDLAITPALAALARSNDRLATVTADLGEWSHLTSAFAKHRPDAVIHCAAIVGVALCAELPTKALRVNVEGAINLFEAMRMYGVKRVVHISTEETYGDFLAPVIDEEHLQKPTSIYGVTKLAVEHYGRVYSLEHGLECINARTCWVYGPGLPRPRMPKTFIDAALRGEPFHMPDGGDLAVDQVHISDTVAGVLLALDKPVHRYESYNIATGQAPTIAEVAAIVNAAVPGARISAASTGEYRHAGRWLCAKKGALDIRRAQAELGYAPRYDIRSGILATLAATRAEMAAARQPG